MHITTNSSYLEWMSREPAPAHIFFDEPTDHEPAHEILEIPSTTMSTKVLNQRHYYQRAGDGER